MWDAEQKPEVGLRSMAPELVKEPSEALIIRVRLDELPKGRTRTVKDLKPVVCPIVSLVIAFGSRILQALPGGPRVVRKVGYSLLALVSARAVLVFFLIVPV